MDNRDLWDEWFNQIFTMVQNTPGIELKKQVCSRTRRLFGELLAQARLDGYEPSRDEVLAPPVLPFKRHLE